MYANVRGIKSKLISINEVLVENNPHLFLLTETLLRTDTGLNIPGYTFYGKKREERTGGGVGILVRNDVRNNVASHISEKNIEMMWVSVRRKNSAPLIIGIYYGKQECRTSKGEIEAEMQLLNEEIEEKSQDGEILIAMDGNGKIGLLGEKISRNGQLLSQTFENTGLYLINNSDKCHGKITRQNTKNSSEQSAIDFIVANETVKNLVKTMTIDEEGIHKIRGKNQSDHNTILLSIEIEKLDRTRIEKRTVWNLKASEGKWKMYEEELSKRREKASAIIIDPHTPIDIKYKKWIAEIEQAARASIGKTTVKTGGKGKVSLEIKRLQTMKIEKKKEIREKTDVAARNNAIGEYKEIQDQIHKQMVTEKTSYIEKKFNQINSDKSRTSFWKEKRQMTRNNNLDALAIKDEKGKRKYEPEEIKECMAKYYEDLYRYKPKTPHPYHDEVHQKIQNNISDFTHDNLYYNLPPTKEEIRNIIRKKEWKINS